MGIRIQRYIFTPLLAVLLWPLTMWLIGDMLISNARDLPTFSTMLVFSVFSGTLAGIWSLDVFTKKWSEGEADLMSVNATLSRVFIAVAANAIFSMYYSTGMHVFGVPNYRFIDAFLGRGFATVVPAVWIAASIVDVLVRKKAPMPPQNLPLRNKSKRR
jgi:hypothetical protein